MLLTVDNIAAEQWTDKHNAVSMSIDNWSMAAKPKPHPSVCSEDLLALSACWYRIRTEHISVGDGIESLLDQQLAERITPADREFAGRIRDHFSKKIMLWALKGNTLTKFRSDMSEFIHSTGNKFEYNTLPLVYRLPEFYLYDLEFGALKDKFNKNPIPRNGFQTVKLTPVQYLQRKLKSGNRHEYWFKNDTGVAYLVLVKHDDSCKPLWDREFKKRSMTLACSLFPMEQDELPYYKVVKWDIPYYE